MVGVQECHHYGKPPTPHVLEKDIGEQTPIVTSLATSFCAVFTRMLI